MQEMSLLANKVTDVEIADVLSRATGIPVAKMLEQERDKLLNMEADLTSAVLLVNHEAVTSVSNAIRRSRAGLKLILINPLDRFLFLGPTGVGKTELTKSLGCSFYLTREEALIRVDMSEFMEKHSVARLSRCTSWLCWLRGRRVFNRSGT